MAKQIHLRLEDSLFEALAEYTAKNGVSVNDFISNSIMQSLSNQLQAERHDADFTFIDLFAGIGGMRIAFETNGGDCVYSNEWNKYCQQTYFANFGEQPDGDITKIDARIIPNHDILVAGYISLGECAEDAVRREVREETGMEVERIRFNRTQYYEPSNALMCNFTAFVRDDSELHVNSEIDSFTWFTPDEARQNIRKGSLAQYFLNMYLDETESMEKGKETG